MLEFSTRKRYKARKEHKCSLCGRPIQEKSKYIRFSGKYDGYMFDEKFHPVCDALITEYCRWSGEYEYGDDDVIDMIRERTCFNCRHYNEDMDDFEEIDCNPYSCEIVMKEILSREDGADNG